MQRKTIVFAVVVLLGGALITPAVAATDGSPQVTDTQSFEEAPAFTVALDQNGDATVVLTLTYNLTDDADEAAFNRLAEQPTAVTDPFETRLSRIATQTAATTGREMAVSNATVTTTAREGVGTVQLEARWERLAAVRDGALVVREPFASGFEPDRPFIIVAPAGYELQSTAVAPQSRDGATARWSANTDLSGFEATFEEGSGVTDDSMPTPLTSMLGFGAALLGSYVAWRRRG